jgi:hypothetical protein
VDYVKRENKIYYSILKIICLSLKAGFFKKRTSLQKLLVKLDTICYDLERIEFKSY